MWNKYDLFYLLLLTLFHKRVASSNKKLPENDKNFKIFIEVLLNIFGIKKNYDEILNSIKKNTTNIKILFYNCIKRRKRKIIYR